MLMKLGSHVQLSLELQSCSEINRNLQTQVGESQMQCLTV